MLFAKNESKSLEYVLAWLNFELGMTTCFFEGLRRVSESRTAVRFSALLAVSRFANRGRV